MWPLVSVDELEANSKTSQAKEEVVRRKRRGAHTKFDDYVVGMFHNESQTNWTSNFKQLMLYVMCWFLLLTESDDDEEETMKGNCRLCIILTKYSAVRNRLL